MLCLNAFAGQTDYPPGTWIKLTHETTAYAPKDPEKKIGTLPVDGLLRVVGEQNGVFLQANYRSIVQKRDVPVLIRKDDLRTARIKFPDSTPAPDRPGLGETEGSTIEGSSFTTYRPTHATLRSLAATANVTYREINNAFGVPMFRDDSLWDDPVADIADRLGWPVESHTPNVSSYRLYADESYRLLDARPYSLALYGEKEAPQFFSLIFANKGDLKGAELDRAMRESGKNILTRLTETLGTPRNEIFGQGKNLTEKVQRWDWKGHAFLLSNQAGEYTGLKILPSGAADAEGKGLKLRDTEIRAMLGKRVETKANGDVLITQIPMVNQGPKGYCVPATWERYLRFLEIPADMYVLAMAAQTDEGGGTSITHMLDASKNLIMRYGCKLVEVKNETSIANLNRYIDRGIPVMWVMNSGTNYNKSVDTYTHARAKAGADWGKEQAAAAQTATRTVNDEGSHICMIIGYNKRFNEFAVSDSWGPHFALRWIPVDAAQIASHRNKQGFIKISPFYVIRF